MTNFDRITNMTIEEMAEFFAIDKQSNFPPSPCYLCEYDTGICCDRDGCDNDFKVQRYQKWLESEYVGNIKKCCRTCRYWSKALGGICLHKSHSGGFVQEYTVCDDYES